MSERTRLGTKNGKLIGTFEVISPEAEFMTYLFENDVMYRVCQYGNTYKVAIDHYILNTYDGIVGIAAMFKGEIV